jgi:beta-lactamase regulating signal transducer with metallopeptidase domain
MDPAKPSLLRRVLAILVLVLVAAVAIRLAVGLAAGLVAAVLWILVVAALLAAGLWARSILKSTKRRRGVKAPSSSATKLDAAPGEDPVAVEMRRITEQLREQGRR